MIGPVLRGGLELRLTGEIISRPYIDLTLWLMNAYGAEAEWNDIDTITVKPKPYTGRRWLIENDWSAASYWYEMMALSNNRDDELARSALFAESKAPIKGADTLDFPGTELGSPSSRKGFPLRDAPPGPAHTGSHRILWQFLS